MRRVTRRGVLKMGATAAAGLAIGQSSLPALAQSQRLSVLSPQRPDPIPPGVSNFAVDLLTTWQTDHDTGVDYTTQPFFEMAQATSDAVASGGYVHDIFYNWATIPENAGSLVELGSRLPNELTADLAPSQAASVSWQGKQYGVVPTLSLLLLFFNRDILASAGIGQPPATWDELKATAAAFATESPNGLLLPYGAPAGIGGVASIWMAFLQQAGGAMYNDDGKPVFDDAPGVDALQFMIDLLPITTSDSLRLAGYGDAAYRMMAGSAAMTFSFPAFWTAMNGGAAPGEGRIAPAVMPKGPDTNATINGVDAWTIATASPNQELAEELIAFYLSPDVQKRQAIDTGWLPARLSVLGDAEVQSANPVAAVLLEQATSPFDSFITPNYLAITDAIGREIQQALRGEQTASQALTTAKSAIQPLISW
ncbi:MAG TPA: extracellular solute-binding protein [Thermomicrobiales bacterium]|nr:extracellular solute-binding protein [Thermomicrobiales bacterium]